MDEAADSIADSDISGMSAEQLIGSGPSRLGRYPIQNAEGAMGRSVQLHGHLGEATVQDMWQALPVPPAVLDNVSAAAEGQPWQSPQPQRLGPPPKNPFADFQGGH